MIDSELKQLTRKSDAARSLVAQKKLEDINSRIETSRKRGATLGLQKAALRFLPGGAQLSAPRVLDLKRWPYERLHKPDVHFLLKALILSEDQFCRWCRTEPATTIDHVRPLNRGGTNDLYNLVGSCADCNSAKSDYLPSELGWVLHLPARAFDMPAFAERYAIFRAQDARIQMEHRIPAMVAQLQTAAIRFLPPNEVLDFTPTLDLIRWPLAVTPKLSKHVSAYKRSLVLTPGGLCVWCQRERATRIGRIHPLARGGSNSLLNLVGTCETCNTIKASFMPKEVGWVLHVPQHAFALAFH